MTHPFEVVRHPTARRIRLSLDPASGRARLVVPRRARLADAIAWAEEKADWLAQQRAVLPQAKPFTDGTTIPVADAPLTITWREGTRLPRREGDLLLVGGPPDLAPKRVERWLRRTALDLLTQETQAIADKANVTVTQVSIGDPKARWGSCASTGAIRYSWRLILAPGFVRRATVAHEVAHRLHMHHGPAFHAAAAGLLGEDPAPARAWLRSHGASLHWFGRSSGAGR